MNIIEQLILSKLLKSGRIKAINPIEYYLTSGHAHSLDSLEKQANSISPPTSERIAMLEKVVISKHGGQRWNERVGPSVDLTRLQEILEIILLHFPYRFRKMAEGIGTIDEDIVFTYEFENKKTLIITTFYGRKSLVPSLNLVKQLRRYNQINKAYIELEIPKENLETQLLPLVPKELIQFKGRKSEYLLEKHQVTGFKQPFFVLFIDYTFRGIIDLENPSGLKLSNNVLVVLNRMGYHEFVFDYFKHFNPSKVHIASEKVQEYMEKTELTDEI